MDEQKLMEYLDKKFAGIDAQFARVDEKVSQTATKEDMDQGFKIVDHNLTLVLDLLEGEDKELKEKVEDHERRIKHLEQPLAHTHTIRQSSKN